LAEPLLTQLNRATAAAERYAEAVRNGLRSALAPSGQLDSALLEREQFTAHGYAWVATTVAALRAVRDWVDRVNEAGQLGEAERLIAALGFGEYLAQLLGGIAMSQGEVIRPADLGATEAATRLAADEGVRALLANGNTPETRARIAQLAADGVFGVTALGDRTLESVREPFRRVAEEIAEPFHRLHLKDELIPLDLIERDRHRGTFGLKQPQFLRFGGNGIRGVGRNGAEDGAVGGLAYFDGGELRFGVQIGHG